MRENQPEEFPYEAVSGLAAMGGARALYEDPQGAVGGNRIKEVRWAKSGELAYAFPGKVLKDPGPTPDQKDKGHPDAGDARRGISPRALVHMPFYTRGLDLMRALRFGTPAEIHLQAEELRMAAVDQRARSVAELRHGPLKPANAKDWTDEGRRAQMRRRQEAHEELEVILVPRAMGLADDADRAADLDVPEHRELIANRIGERLVVPLEEYISARAIQAINPYEPTKPSKTLDELCPDMAKKLLRKAEARENKRKGQEFTYSDFKRMEAANEQATARYHAAESLRRWGGVPKSELPEVLHWIAFQSTPLAAERLRWQADFKLSCSTDGLTEAWHEGQDLSELVAPSYKQSPYSPEVNLAAAAPLTHPDCKERVGAWPQEFELGEQILDLMALDQLGPGTLIVGADKGSEYYFQVRAQDMLCVHREGRFPVTELGFDEARALMDGYAWRVIPMGDSR